LTGAGPDIGDHLNRSDAGKEIGDGLAGIWQTVFLVQSRSFKAYRHRWHLAIKNPPNTKLRSSDQS
jgi:hypothetical protein